MNQNVFLRTSVLGGGGEGGVRKRRQKNKGGRGPRKTHYDREGGFGIKASGQGYGKNEKAQVVSPGLSVGKSF